MIVLAVIWGATRIYQTLKAHDNAWRRIRFSPPIRFEWEEEKSKRKCISSHEAYMQRLEEIENEATYQRRLAHEEYVEALKETAQPTPVIALYPADVDYSDVVIDEDSDWYVYTPIQSLREE